MKLEKHEQIIQEVLDEIDSALHDKRGLVSHQRRIAFSLSLGAVNLIEIYFRKLNIAKEGSTIDHRWFKKKQETIKENLQRQITAPVDSIKNIQKIIDLTCSLEEKRDILAYGSPATEKLLQEKINLFFALKDVTQC